MIHSTLNLVQAPTTSSYSNELVGSVLSREVSAVLRVLLSDHHAVVDSRTALL